MAVVSRPIELRVGTGRILIGTPTLLPPERRRPHHQVAVLHRLFASPGAVRQLQQLWRQLPLGGSHAAHLTPMEMHDAIERAIVAQRIALVWLPPLFTGTIQIDRLPKPKTPLAGAGQRVPPRLRIEDMPTIEKVALAVQRSLDHVRGDTRRKLVELRQAIERLDERDVALIVGGFALLAVPVVGEALGAAILAWTCWEFGYEGIAFAYGLGAASRVAAEARTEADIDLAARRYAEAFEHLGKAFIAWLLIRLQIGGLRRAAAETAAAQTTARGAATETRAAETVGRSDAAGSGTRAVTRSQPPLRKAPPPAAAEKVTRTVGDLRARGLKDAHHVIQDAAVRDLPGYNTNLAPGVQLKGPSTLANSPHYLATQAQRISGGGTYGAERDIAYRSLRAAGYTDATASQALKEADAYFASIGVTPTTPTRIPGNRRR